MKKSYVKKLINLPLIPTTGSRYKRQVAFHNFLETHIKLKPVQRVSFVMHPSETTGI